MVNKISILDSTLQEGGNCNNWDFGKENIKGIIHQLKDSKIDFLDIGILKNRYTNSNYTIINNNNSLQCLLKIAGNVKNIVLTIDLLTPLPIEQIVKLNFPNKVIIKIKFYNRMIDKCVNYINVINAMGAKIILQPVNYSQFTEEQFIKIINVANEIHAIAVYIDDSFGYGISRKKLNCIKLFEQELEKDIVIIFKDNYHNLLFVRDLINMLGEWKHKIAFEGCICGIGMGKINVPTEYLIQCIKKKVKQKFVNTYNLEKIVYASYFYIKKTCKESGYFNTIEENPNKKQISPYFLSYFNYQLKLLDTEIREVLLNIKDNAFFTKKYADKILKRVRENYWNNKMCILVPICNRPNSIEFYLQTTGVRLWQYGIDLIIFDSSTNQKTKEIVEKFNRKGYRNIKYKFYNGYYDGLSLDHKIIEAYKLYWNQYEYIWICRDGITIDFDYIHMYIKNLIELKMDLIIVDSEWRDIKKTGNKIYTDCRELFKDQCIRMVTLGTVIVSSNFIRKVVFNIPIENTNYSLWQVISIFQYYAIHPLEVKVASYVGNVFVYNPKGTISSFWNTNGKALWQWAERWCIVIKLLPSIYDDYKSKMYPIEMIDFHPFSVKTLLLIKANGGLSLFNIIKYIKYLKYVSTRPIWQYYVLSLFPISKKVLKSILMDKDSIPYKICKGVYKIIRDCNIKNYN